MRRIAESARAVWVPRAAARLLTITGAVMLGWCALVAIEARLPGPPVATPAFAADDGAASDAKRSAPVSVRAVKAPRLTEGSVLGRLEMPRLGIDTPIREGESARTLRLAVGRMPRTVWPPAAGNAGLAGHRDTFLRALSGVRKGDELWLRVGGHRLPYVVSDIRIVDPSETWVLERGHTAAVTIVTCYPFRYVGAAPQRFIVRAVPPESVVDSAAALLVPPRTAAASR
jgi:sortase A